jgi:uncharacterized membrane protein YbaN (DUF454 family)
VDSEQAKQILQAYRPGVDDAEPSVAEALAQAGRDPELSRWLEQQTAFDAVIRARLREVPAPVGLKTRILANVPAETPAVAWWQRRPVWLAAALIALVLVYLPYLRPSNTFAAYRAGMVQYVASGYAMEVRADNFDALRERFSKDGWPADYVLPPGLTRLTVEGGCRSQWRGQKVSLLCLQAGDHDVWLCVIDRSAVWHEPGNSPVFAREGRIATASWTSGHLTYLLATEGDEAELKSYL